MTRLTTQLYPIRLINSLIISSSPFFRIFQIQIKWEEETISRVEPISKRNDCIHLTDSFPFSQVVGPTHGLFLSFFFFSFPFLSYLLSIFFLFLPLSFGQKYYLDYIFFVNTTIIFIKISVKKKIYEKSYIIIGIGLFLMATSK